MTETEKMLAGKIYDASDSHLADRRIVAHRLSKQYNDTFEDEAEKRTAILKDIVSNRNRADIQHNKVEIGIAACTECGIKTVVELNRPL